MSDRCRKCAALLVFSAEECSDAAACAARTHSAQTTAALRDQLEAVTRERDEARADAARLREALKRMLRRHSFRAIAGGCCLACENAEAALASTPSVVAKAGKS